MQFKVRIGIHQNDKTTLLKPIFTSIRQVETYLQQNFTYLDFASLSAVDREADDFLAFDAYEFAGIEHGFYPIDM